MASSPITSWQIDGEIVKTMRDFIFFWRGGSKITADGNCTHEIKIHLLLGRIVMTNLNSILKSRDVALPTKAHLVKALVFPVVMYGCKPFLHRSPLSPPPTFSSLLNSVNLSWCPSLWRIVLHLT